MRLAAVLLLVALPAFGAGPEFTFTPETARLKVWGPDWGRPYRHHFDERLPAIFERTLEIDELDLGTGELEWIFTGPRGGFTIGIKQKEVTLSVRFYDSYALNGSEPGRHPERVVGRQTTSFVEGFETIKKVTVRVGHKLDLSLLVDGRDVERVEFLLDVQRHQVVYTGTEPPAGRIHGRLALPPPTSVSLQVDPSVVHQTMIGFGGITTPTAYAELNESGKQRWWDLIQEYNLLLQREYPNGTRLNEAMDNFDRLADATPHYYGDNFPNGEISDFEYLRRLRQLGGKTVFQFWELPMWARQDWRNSDGKLHEGVANPEPYARAMVRYCEIHKERTGVAPAIVGIQNERRQPPEIWRQMAVTLREALDKAGFEDVKIHTRDSGRLEPGIEDIRGFKAFSDAWEAIDYSAVHMYDFQNYFSKPDEFDTLMREWAELTADRPFLSTELCINSPRYQLDSYRLALAMGQLYHKNLTITDAAAIFYCWLLLNVEQPSYGATRSLMVPDHQNGSLPVASSHQLRVFGAFSRHVLEGMRRVAVRNANADLLATAFTGGGQSTVVLLNRALHPQVVTLNWPGVEFRTLEFAGPYSPNLRGEYEAVAGVEVPPGSVATLTTR